MLSTTMFHIMDTYLVGGLMTEQELIQFVKDNRGVVSEIALAQYCLDFIRDLPEEEKVPAITRIREGISQ